MSADREEQIRRAAEMRAEGNSWDKIARYLGVATSVVHEWRRIHEQLWDECYERAKRDLNEAAGIEGLTVLRTLLRSKDEKVQRDCARELAMRFTLTQITTQARATDFHRLADFLDGLSDDELHSLLERECATDAERPSVSPAHLEDPSGS